MFSPLPFPLTHTHSFFLFLFLFLSLSLSVSVCLSLSLTHTHTHTQTDPPTRAHTHTLNGVGCPHILSIPHNNYLPSPLARQPRAGPSLPQKLFLFVPVSGLPLRVPFLYSFALWIHAFHTTNFWSSSPSFSLLAWPRVYTNKYCVLKSILFSCLDPCLPSISFLVFQSLVFPHGLAKNIQKILQRIKINEGLRGGAVGWGTALQAGRSRVRFPMVSLEFFYWHNHSSRTMALGLTHPLTEIYIYIRRPVRRSNNLITFMCPLSWNVGASASWNPQGLSRPVMG